MSHPSVLELSDLNFDAEVLASESPVLVDFTASWCGPCKVLGPIVDQVAAESGGAFKVGKVDVDKAPATAAKYGIRGVPTVMVFRAGERKGEHVGLLSKDKLVALVRAGA